jgi:hypothetical protein
MALRSHRPKPVTLGKLRASLGGKAAKRPAEPNTDEKEDSDKTDDDEDDDDDDDEDEDEDDKDDDENDDENDEARELIRDGFPCPLCNVNMTHAEIIIPASLKQVQDKGSNLSRLCFDTSWDLKGYNHAPKEKEYIGEMKKKGRIHWKAAHNRHVMPIPLHYTQLKITEKVCQKLTDMKSYGEVKKRTLTRKIEGSNNSEAYKELYTRAFTEEQLMEAFMILAEQVLQKESQKKHAAKKPRKA